MTEFSYTPAEKNLDDYPSVNEGAEFRNVIVAFIQVESSDEDNDVASREKKLVNHLKWAARKNNTQNIVLHSFAHLSSSRASIPFTANVLDLAEKRLLNAGYIVSQTPFGYFLNLKMEAPGYSQARIWAEL